MYGSVGAKGRAGGGGGSAETVASHLNGNCVSGAIRRVDRTTAARPRSSAFHAAARGEPTSRC